jgi:L-ribulose-5-phosphate 3-epimerase
MQTRRRFIESTAALGMFPALAKTNGQEISLAAWSIVQSFFLAKKWKNLDLPRIARQEFGIGALEFVNQFFENPTLNYLKELKRNAETHAVKLVRIMVDDEGEMSAVDKRDRMQASIAHRRWIDAAHFLGCQDIRANMRGGPADWKHDKDLVQRAAESFRHLLEYAHQAGIGVIIETHGGASSDADTLVAVMKEVNDPAFGILIDLININRDVDYEGSIRKMLPFAKGISFHPIWVDENSNPGFDIDKAIRTCLQGGFKGYWGIESGFGPRMPSKGPLPAGVTPDQVWEWESKGVRLAKAILERDVVGS